MTPELKQKLVFLAQKYETSDFCKQDPCQFLRWYTDSVMAETAAFVAAMLSFGSRKQFIPKIQNILQTADSNGGILDWITNSEIRKRTFATGNKKFYRFYSYDDMHSFFDDFAQILEKEGSLGNFVKKEYEKQLFRNDCTKNTFEIDIAGIISSAFPHSAIVPKGRNCANKRIHMFLRWMVRTASPVDLGLWTWIEADKLIIPLDVHVLKESQNLGLLGKNCTPNLKAAKILTAQMKEIWPKDPVRADFALFGLGIDTEKK